VPYVRIALMQPLPERARDVREMQEELLRFDKILQGFLGGYLLDTSDGTNRIGRLVLWETKEDADRAAQHPHTLKLRSDLLPLIRRGHLSRVDVGVEAIRV
jgi:hypothetical protein